MRAGVGANAATQCYVLPVIRLFGISLGLVGTTVLGGMGLSYAHEVLYVDPTPVRAQVLSPAPVLSRAAPVLTRDAPVVTRAVEDAQKVQVARLMPEAAPVATDAVALIAATPVPESTGTPLRAEPDGPPLLSTRPRLRTERPETRTAALDAPARAPVTRRVAPATRQVFVPPTPEAPVQRARPQQTPRFVIGVYR